ncbi:MAG: hypothetical protein LUE96_09385 [Lachnospiraceae bacterium]|nr:hypothetical protein [Lachnospiraceae bacterium]
MGKGNIVYHNLRMNLDNEQHRRVHLVLSDLNTDVHKSVNQFLIDAADSYISRLAGSELTNKGQQSGECPYITKEDMEQLRREMKDELQKEMIVLLGSALTGNKGVTVQEVRAEHRKQRGTEEDTDADETTLGLASSWG